MEQPKSEVPKLSENMIEERVPRMCGDHPSFTKAGLNAREPKPEDREQEKKVMSYAKISPSSSRTERTSETQLRAASGSELAPALRGPGARRRVRPAGPAPPDGDPAPAGRALVQAALGSLRWPPYVLAVWAAALLLAHALHALGAALQRALPALAKLCQYFRSWTEESWKQHPANHRLLPAALATVTGLCYAAYWALWLVYRAVLWALEPLCAEEDRPADQETSGTSA